MDIKINKLPLAFMKCPYEKAIIYVRNTLLLISLLAIVSSLTVSIVYAVKTILIIATSVFVTRETEILYLTHDKKIKRAEAKEITKQTYPMITGLIYALILPVGTPIYVVAVGAFIAIFIGKMVFGGFSYNPFNPAIIGRLFVTLSWPLLLTNELNEGLVNFLLSKLNGDISVFNPTNIGSYAFEFNNIFGNIGDIGFVALIFVMVFLLIKRVINPISTLLPILVFVVVIFSVTADISKTLELVISNSMLFCLTYLASDPFTTPVSSYGRIVYGLIIGLTSSVMIYLGTSQIGIVYAILFANLFVPFINSTTLKIRLNNKPKVVKLVAVSLVVLVLTIVTISISSTEVISKVGESI